MCPRRDCLLGNCEVICLNNNSGTVFSVLRGPCRGNLRESNFEAKSYTRLEAGSNTSTVTLRVVGGEEKGSLKSETVKYGHEFQGTRTRESLGW
jgi:hypothetical protein